ncbi:MAG: LysR family transcriptional regulator [Hoeflea sp.]|uniref:LysR family transcriptional regulator n=1 Tax=Hoeflea sp. TaxID=1940281 RepID=UPI001D78BC63|nr:LysR family transcriptional regulator [Hoeflea sp.]MBU4529596.1 LysR family transcriptional regulator [Alphaproteobacteria bacterium]MBU4546715.1 LysR family transcriptional regulator [Alphaproteobacteria bacterium]MBU4550983.1 LysR family transcriptional regulator [Alphaproteobacteria bacterium]MBV1723925.1 LysR family transcriptional regulator [Hoeflea sp.]MBV1763202.1 LysR family transcriptional regulator [Hoeflea sp.]
MRHLTTFEYVDAVARMGSIRGAAEVLAITSTALNRRILALEDELGVQIFERLPRGVRLSSAGELLIHHIRTQIVDMDRVKSQIADLSGVRRGNVSIACSQALLPYFLPEQITDYRRLHPGVRFGVYLRDRAAAEKAIADLEADLALVFEPVRMAEFQTIHAVPQQIHAVMTENHPLAGHETLRLKECLLYPVAMPTRSYGVRYLIERALVGSNMSFEPVVESDSFEFLRNHAAAEGIISFQIPIGLPPNGVIPGVITRPVDSRDVPAGLIYLGQLRGRSLPVATARFVDQIVKVMEQRYPRDGLLPARGWSGGKM